MTIASEDARSGPYNGNGSTTVFAYDFKALDQAHLVVTLKNSLGVETVQTITTHYSVSGVGDEGGGNVTMVTPPASGQTLTITRSVPLTQGVDLQNRGGVQPNTLETAYDRLTQISQDTREVQQRTVKFPVSSLLSGIEMPGTATSNAVISWNSSGTALVNGPTSTEISNAESNATAAAASASAASASATLASQWATKTDGQVASTDYSSKAWAIGGTGVTDTASAGAAKEWATAAEDDLVDGTEYSAKHYSAKASASASAASTSETNAANSAAAAAASAAGIFWKEPVVNATTANITLSGEQTIDGVLTSTSRILVKNQTNAAENGVYVTASGAWARATPLDTWDEHVGAAVIVSDGTTNADTAWICTVDAGGTLETTDITWGQLSQVYSTATTSSEGITEYATAAEVTTGTDATRSITPDALAGSNYGTAVVQIFVFDDATDCATGDGAGDVFFRVPSTINGFDLVGVAAQCQTAGTTGTMDVQIHNVTQAADMLTTKITIDSAETDSSTAATAAVIDTANDDVATGDQIRIDVDAVHTTAAKGLLVELQFRLP